MPFSIRTSRGRDYIVLTAEHAAINPKGSRVIVFADDDSQAELAALQVATVVRNGQTEITRIRPRPTDEEQLRCAVLTAFANALR